MGQANKRGSFEQRRAAAITRQTEARQTYLKARAEQDRLDDLDYQERLKNRAPDVEPHRIQRRQRTPPALCLSRSIGQ